MVYAKNLHEYELDPLHARYLRAELTIACDHSDRRMKWVSYAILCTFVYFVGEWRDQESAVHML